MILLFLLLFVFVFVLGDLTDGKDKTTSPTLLLALLVFSTTWDDRNREVVWCFCLYQSPLLVCGSTF